MLSRADIGKIVPQRSQKIEANLLSAPYRTFLNNSGEEKQSLLIYCVPASISEYICFQEEVSKVRSKLVALGERNVVAFYDTHLEKIVGASVDDVLLALGGDNSARVNLASSALAALAAIDNEVANYIKKKDENVVIVVGSGGREHAIAVALAKSPLVDKVICCPGNGGTEKEGGKIVNKGSGQDNQTVIAMVKETSASMVVVGPEAPLVDGLVDELEQSCPGVKAFGPSKAAAQLEASKVCY